MSTIAPDPLAELADPQGNVKIMAPDFGPRERVTLTKAATAGSRGMYGVGGNNLLEELGRTGLRHWGGFVFEEWLRELQSGRRAAEVYREMGDSDPVIGGMLYAIEMLVRRVDWWVEPGGTTQADLRYADYCESLRHDLNHSWTDIVAEILSFLQYGWAYFETVFKLRGGMQTRDPTQRSQFDDGLVGLRKLSLRSQDSLWKWVFDDNDAIEGLIQNPPPDYLLRYVPVEKALLFRTKIFKNNPEGRSILRSAYRPWYFLKNLQNVEGIGVERDLAGLPTLTAPENVDIWSSTDPSMAGIRQQAQNVVSSIRRDEQEGVLLPYGWKLELLSTGGRRQFDTNALIGRYENRIATSVLLDVILMGQDKVGSYALAGVKKGLFTASLEAYLDQISAVFDTYLWPKMFALNGFTGYTALPKLRHGTIETVDLDTLGNYVGKLAGAGAPLFGSDIEDPLFQYLLAQAGLPSPGADAHAEATMNPTARAVTRGQARRALPAGAVLGT